MDELEKRLWKHANRIFLIILLPIIGIIIGILLAEYEASPEREPWIALHRPPGTPIKKLLLESGIYVETTSDDIYQYKGIPNCWSKELENNNFDCWEEVSTYPKADSKINTNIDCEYPILPKVYIEEMHSCELVNVSPIAKIVYISQDGEVYYWQNSYGEGEGLAYVYYPTIGALSLLGISIIIVLILYLIDVIRYIRSKKS